MKRALLTLTGASVLCAVTGQAMADPAGVMLPAVLANDVKIRLDGVPKEFPGSWNSLETAISGKKQSARFAQGAIAYDEANLYVAMRLEDTKIVRTAAAGPNEDHAILSLAVPVRTRSYHTYQIELYPGQPGKLSGVVKLGDSKVAGAELVEAPDGDGLTFEAKIPWAALPESAKCRVGMRASLRYVDFTAPGQAGSTMASSPAREGGAMPRLLVEAEHALYTGVLQPKGLSAEPVREAIGNVAGDATREHVAIYDKYLVVTGSRFREGKEFLLSELPVNRGKAVQRLELADFDGDGADEVLLVFRVGSESTYREVLQVLRTKPDQSLSLAFVHEVGQKTLKGELHNEVSVKRDGGKALLVIAQGESQGYEEASYSEPKPSDMDAALLPWDAAKDQSFALSGSEFAKVSETKQKPGKGGGKGSLGTASRANREMGGSVANGGEVGSRAASPPPPRAPTAEEMLDQVYSLYLRDRAVKTKKPRFDFVTDVAADSTNERVLIYDKDIVCFGKRFRDGKSYAYTTMGVGSPDDIIDVTARDLTGDGKAEILVRAVLHSKASKELDKKPVDRFVFFVFQIKEDGIKRIFGAETGRSFDGHLILSGMRFIDGPHGTEIEITPGSSHGFTKDNYPFPEDTTPVGGCEPMPLPWGTLGTKRFRFEGGRFASS